MNMYRQLLNIIQGWRLPTSSLGNPCPHSRKVFPDVLKVDKFCDLQYFVIFVFYILENACHNLVYIQNNHRFFIFIPDRVSQQIPLSESKFENSIEKLFWFLG